jgi:chromosomal replication initiator protein
MNAMKLIRKRIRGDIKEFILQVVSRYYDISPERILSPTRKREVVLPRQMCMKLAKDLTKDSLATIGGYYGGKDHATVLHACRTINNLTDLYPDHRQDLEEISKSIKGYALMDTLPAFFTESFYQTNTKIGNHRFV